MVNGLLIGDQAVLASSLSLWEAKKKKKEEDRLIEG